MSECTLSGRPNFLGCQRVGDSNGADEGTDKPIADARAIYQSSGSCTISCDRWTGGKGTYQATRLGAT